MSVQVSMPTTNNPVLSNGGKIVADAFMRVYGPDVKKAGVLNGIYEFRRSEIRNNANDITKIK